MAEIENVESWLGVEVVDSEDEKVGKLEDLFMDTKTEEVRYGLVKAGLLGRRHVVPLEGATFGRGYVRIGCTKELALASPVSDGDQLTVHDEVAIHRHFDLRSEVAAGPDEEVRMASGQALVRRRQEADAELRRAEELEAKARAKDEEAATLASWAKERAESASSARSERDELLAEAAEKRSKAEAGSADD